MSNYSEIIRALQQYSGNNAFNISSLPANFDGVVLAINAMTADFQTSFDNIEITESQITDLQPYLLAADIVPKADLLYGKLLDSQVPELAITEYKGAVADQSAMLAITGSKGDWVIRNDESKVYVIVGDNPALSTDWQAWSYPHIPTNNSELANGAGYLTVSDTIGQAVNADKLDDQEGSFYQNASNLNAGTIPDARIADIGDSEARKICFDDLEKSNLYYDGDLAYDASQGLIIYRSQQGVSGSPAAVTVLDGANVSAGTGISISNLGAGATDASQIEFSLIGHSAALLTSGTVPAARISQGSGSGLDADTLDGQEGSYYTGYTDTAVANLVDSSPEALNTLNELAAALGDDPNFATTVTNSIATKLPFAGGEMTGNITFSGTETVDGRDLSVDGSKLDGIEAGATADQTAAEIITAVKTVDGTGSGLDADKLDGQEGTYYTSWNNITDMPAEIIGSNADTVDGYHADELLKSDEDDIFQGILTGEAPIVFEGTLATFDPDGTATDTATDVAIGLESGHRIAGYNDGSIRTLLEWNASNDISIGQGGTTLINGINLLPGSSGEAKVNGNKIWHAGNDGAGTNLDSDKLDGQEGSYYLDYNNFVNTPPAEVVGDTTPQLGGDLDLNSNDITGTGNVNITGNITVSGTVSGTVDGRDVSADGTKLDGIESGATADQTASEILTAVKTVDGTGSGLDADLLDNYEGSYYLDYNNFVNTPPAEVVGDTTPQLGGNLDLNSNDITGTGNISITGNITLSGNIDGRDVSADGTKLDGIESGATADQTAAEILTAIKTVDGAGSGLNADKLRDIEPTGFLRSNADDTFENILTGNAPIVFEGTLATFDPDGGGPDTATDVAICLESGHRIAGYSNGYIRTLFEWNASNDINIGQAGTVLIGGINLLPGSSGEAKVNGDKIWHSGNDGAGTGLDADLLDGRHRPNNFGNSSGSSSYVTTADLDDDYNVVGASVFYPAGGSNVTGDPTDSHTGNGYLFTIGMGDNGGRGAQILASDGGDQQFYFRTKEDAGWKSWNRLLTIDANDTLSKNLTVDNGTSTLLNVKCDNGGNAIVRAGGDGQGTGVFEVSQDNGTSGGGISYNGDGSPAFVSGESADHVTFYRMESGTRTEVFHYAYNNSNVLFEADITASGNVTAYSDIRLKDNIKPIDNAIDKVQQINGVTFDRTDEPELSRQLGVIAQDVEKVCPEVVSTDEDGIKSVAYGNMVGLLIEAVKEQQVQINKLQEKLNDLEGK